MALFKSLGFENGIFKEVIKSSHSVAQSTGSTAVGIHVSHGIMTSL